MWHLFLKCRKWRAEREIMIRKLRDKEVATTETTGWRKVRTLFEDNAVVEVLEFIEKIGAGAHLEVMEVVEKIADVP
jgi:hypothetical protein